MALPLHTFWTVLATACLGTAAAIGAALGQTLPDRGAQRAIEPAMATGPLRSTPPSVATQPSEDLAEAAPDPSVPPPIPTDDPSADLPDPFADEDEPRPRSGQRAAIRDGDLNGGEAAVLQRDGSLDVEEPLAPEDGADATLIDSRPPEEFELFQNPDDTADPLLFQIEDIDRVETDRRPRRFFAREPYDPVGIRIGSFVYFPEAEVSGLATSNVLRQSPANGDVAGVLRTDSRLVSDWKQHALEFRTTSLTSLHNAFPGEDDRAWGVEARGRLDITRRTNLQGLAGYDVAQEGRSAIDANQSGDRADIATNRAALTLNHRFNRLSVQLRGSVDQLDFGPSAASGGGVGATNADRNTRQTREAVRASWEFKPTFSVFGEAEINQRRYEVAALSDSLIRDSDGERYRIGVDFGSTGSILRGEISLGWGEQDPKAAGLDTIDGLLVDANLAWRMSELTSLFLTARSDIFDTTTAGSGGVFSRQAGAEIRHQFQRHLIATAGVAVTHQNYEGVLLEETELRASLGLEYFLNREWILFGRYEHIDYDSSANGGDWKSDDVRLGMRWRR